MAAQHPTKAQKALQHHFQKMRHVLAELDLVAAELSLQETCGEPSLAETHPPVQGLVEAILDSASRLNPALEACSSCAE